MKLLSSILSTLSLALALGQPLAAQTAAPDPTAGVPVPYTLTFVPAQPASPLPALHSYCLANISATQWLIFGGRYQAGLHQFNPTGDFPGPNLYLWSVNPVAGTALQVADLSKLNPAIGNSLTSTNQECEYHADTGYWYTFGGYGVTRPGTNFQTFATGTRLPVPALLSIINTAGITPAQRQAQVLTLLSNPANQIPVPSALQVTGGAISHMSSGLQFLAFGQIFTGSYNPFTTNPGFTQTYTNQVVPFTISNCTAAQGDACAFTVNTSFGAITSTDPDQPFNRRDFASTYDVDPTTGQERFAIFGGVFKPGAIAAYDYPVYITGAGTSIAATPDHTAHQHFGFYEEPAVVVWDGASSYHTFFGGISHFFLNQTPAQAEVYKLVTQQGRNDGMPFTQDIGTLVETSSGGYAEYVAPQGIPNGNLHGSSVDFVPNLAMSSRFQGTDSTVVNLSTFQPGERQLIGYIYGGIEAKFPLPCIPSHGTRAVGTLYGVYLTRTPWPGLVPASQMTEAIGTFNHIADASRNAVANAQKARTSPKSTAPNPCSTGLGYQAP